MLRAAFRRLRCASQINVADIPLSPASRLLQGRGLLDGEEIEEQQALCVVQANPPVALVQHLGQQVQARDDLAELHGKTQVAALLRDLVGKQQGLAVFVLPLAEDPGGFLDVARLDLLTQMLDERYRRIGLNYAQSLLFLNFLPVQ